MSRNLYRHGLRNKGISKKRTNCLIIFPIFQYDIQHLSRCYDIWLFREMLDIAGHQISILFFPFFHDDFIKDPVFRIGKFNIEFFCINIKPPLMKR